jgi:hypothetical protein
LPNFWRKKETQENPISEAQVNSEIEELSKFIPEQEARAAVEILRKSNCILKITQARKTKFGDYRPPDKSRRHHTITVNGDLNSPAFLITLWHELAHLKVTQIYSRKPKPHGAEWKSIFSLYLFEALERNSFPKSIVPYIIRYAQNPKASTASDAQLYCQLNALDDNSTKTFAFEIAENDLFAIGKKLFKRGELLRTRFLCTELKTNKKYFVHRNAQVERVSLQQNRYDK